MWALICISLVSPNIDFELRNAMEEQAYIESEGLERVRLSCYLPTGNRTADGSIPYEGICASNREHMGQTCIMYDKDLQEVARWECRDIGGNQLLREGKAIDVYRDTMDGAKEMIATYGDYVYVKWMEDEE